MDETSAAYLGYNHDHCQPR